MFSERQKIAMQDGGFTQQALADKIGLTRQAVAQYQAGKTQPNYNYLAAISKELNVSTDYLLGLTDCKSPNTTAQAICKETGLSEQAVDQLCSERINNEKKKF